MKRIKDSENRRLHFLLSRKEEWGEDKIYTLSYHNSDSQKPYIILNSDVFKSFKDNEIISISFKLRPDIKLFFKIAKDNYSEQSRKPISIHKNIVDLITKKYNFNPNKSEVFIRKANKENLALTEIQIEIKEYIPRSELFYLTLNMLNDCVITGQEIYSKDNRAIGVIGKLSNDSLTGMVSFETNIKLTSLTSDIYFIFDISKSSYNYNSHFFLNYEVMICYIKDLLLKLKSQTTYHNIHIYFYTRIFFKGNIEYDKKYIFVRKAANENNKFYFDMYDKIEMFNAEHIDIKEIVYKMNKIYQIYEKIQNEQYQKKFFKNLNEFFFSIRKNLQYSSESKSKELKNNILSFTFEGYERDVEDTSECSPLNDDIFKEINEFELSSFNNIGIFEALIFAISQIDNLKKNKSKKYSPLINIVLSGERFPYYSRTLADKVRTSIYEQYINLIFTYLCTKNKVSIFSKNTDDIKYTNIINNEEYYEIDNFDGDIPSWCKVYYVPHSLLYKNLQKYKKKYKVSLLSKDKNNLEKFPHFQKGFDEELNLDIISLHFKEKKAEKEQKVKDNEILKKKPNLKEIAERYSIKKSKNENYGTQMDKRNSFTSTENLRINLDSERVSNHNLSWLIDNKREKVLDLIEGKLFYEQKKIFINNIRNLEKTSNEIDILEELITKVPIPYFVEYAKDLRIEAKIIKCYVVKNDIDLILKRIDNYFNIIVDNEKDEILETIKNMITKPSKNSFHEKFLLTNRKITNILEFNSNQVEVLQYNIMRKALYFQYYYLIANSINGSIFAKTNLRHKKINWQEKDNFIKREKKFVL